MPIPLAIPVALAAASAASNIYDSYNNARNARDAYNDISDAASAADAANRADIANYKSLVQDTYGPDAAKYSSALDRFLNSDVYQNKGFNYTGDVSEFMDPFANQRAQAEMDAINNSAATGGNRFSSDYLTRLGGRAQARSSEEWEKAWNKLQQDRSWQLSNWQANSANNWNNYNAQQERAKYGIDQYGNAQNNLMQGLGEAYTAGINARNANLQTQATVGAGLANSQQGQGVASQLLNPFASFMGSYYGGK